MSITIHVESRRKSRSTIEKLFAKATIVDVTSKGVEPWVRFSPFFPHGGIPIPNSPGQFAASVEGLWQGLKVFENEDIDPTKWSITNMSGIKRGGAKRGGVQGHRFGVNSKTLLEYREAREKIYLPAYQWVLQNKLASEVEDLRRQAAATTLVLLDYETNADVAELRRPLSHAGLIKRYLLDDWPKA